LSAQPTADTQTYKVAIIAANRAHAEADQIEALEDYVTGKVTNVGLRVISRETMMNAVSGMDRGSAGTKLDAEMAESTSAIRLAQTLGADYLLQVTVSGVDHNKSSVNAYGVRAVNSETVVRVTYKILDGLTGESLAADTVRASRLGQQTAQSSESRSSEINALLEEAAAKVAGSVQRAIARGRITAPSAMSALVNISFTTEVADLYVPDVRINAENTISISDSKFKVSPLSATLTVDGLAVGSVPGTLQVKSGLSKVRVTREGFKPWERTVNFVNGLSLVVTMEMSDEGYAKWKDATLFMNGLKTGAKLTDAEVKVLEGHAKMLEQSGFKVNTTAAPTIQYRSIYGL
jgi:hypothetical protein